MQSTYRPILIATRDHTDTVVDIVWSGGNTLHMAAPYNHWFPESFTIKSKGMLMNRTKRSLAARLTIRKLVTVLILLCLHTTSTTKVLPIPPTRHRITVEMISNFSMAAEGPSSSVLLLIMACDIADLNKSEHQHDMWNVARKTRGLPFLASTCRVRKDILKNFSLSHLGQGFYC